MRRLSFQSQMTEAVDGFGEYDINAFLWGNWYGDKAAQIREASQYVALERLALSPQCGFSTSIIGNSISVEDQKRKLKVIVETAKEVWDHEHSASENI